MSTRVVGCERVHPRFAFGAASPRCFQPRQFAAMCAEPATRDERSVRSAHVLNTRFVIGLLKAAGRTLAAPRFCGSFLDDFDRFAGVAVTIELRR